MQVARHAFENRDWAACANCYTEDGVLLPPNAPMVRGRSNIEAFIAQFPPCRDFKVTLIEIDGVGDLAYVVAAYSITYSPEGAEPFTDTGKELLVLKKQADGSWAYYAECFSTD